MQDVFYIVVTVVFFCGRGGLHARLREAGEGGEVE